MDPRVEDFFGGLIRVPVLPRLALCACLATLLYGYSARSLLDLRRSWIGLEPCGLMGSGGKGRAECFGDGRMRSNPFFLPSMILIDLISCVILIVKHSEMLLNTFREDESVV